MTAEERIRRMRVGTFAVPRLLCLQGSNALIYMLLSLAPLSQRPEPAFAACVELQRLSPLCCQAQGPEGCHCVIFLFLLGDDQGHAGHAVGPAGRGAGQAVWL